MTVLDGHVGTERFVFAGQSVAFAARRLVSDGSVERWRCEVFGDGEVAAWFEMRAKVEAPALSAA